MRRSRLVFLVIAALIALGTVFLAADSYDATTILVVGGVIAILFVVFYFASRRQVIELASAGAAIRQDTAGMNLDTALTFIDTVEEAKNKRYLLNR